MNMSVVGNAFIFASFLSLVTERIVEQFVAPLVDRYPNIKWILPYIALLMGSLVTAAFGVDLFTPLAESLGLVPVSKSVGLVLSGLVVGGGSSFLHDLWPKG